jgi:hypothetical protein
VCYIHRYADLLKRKRFDKLFRRFKRWVLDFFLRNRHDRVTSHALVAVHQVTRFVRLPSGTELEMHYVFFYLDAVRHGRIYGLK